MAEHEQSGLTGTMLGIACLLLIMAIVVIAAMAVRPSGGITVPKGYSVVHVTTTDFAIDAPRALPAGKYEVVVTNHGAQAHEIVMWMTDLPSRELPLEKSGDVNESSTKLGESVLDTGSSLEPGESRVLFAELSQPGHYVLVCNLPKHYRLGMHADLVVH
jgi:uncharacterized cupredoxin-like copper-binding protein